MSDADLRMLDRRARLTGSDEDLAAWLCVLLRVGDGPCGACVTRMRGKSAGSYTDDDLRDLVRRGLISDTTAMVAAMVAAACRDADEKHPCRCAGTGLRLRPHAERAAYCGAPWAREVLPPDEVVGSRHAEQSYAALDGGSIEYRVSGLSRWGREAQVRAAVAAANPVLRRIKPGGVGGQSFTLQQADRARYKAAVAAIEAAEAWLACQCEAHRLALVKSASTPDGGLMDDPWRRMVEVIDASIVGYCGRVSSGFFAEVVGAFARLTSPEAVRSAIQRALVAHALEVLRG